jgi:hypothetical protein
MASAERGAEKLFGGRDKKRRKSALPLQGFLRNMPKNIPRPA